MEKEKNNKEILKATIAVLNYLRDHPYAKDNAEGIAQWWVGEGLFIVKQALALLVNKGIIEEQNSFYKLSLIWSEQIKSNFEQLIEKTMKLGNNKF